MTPRTLLGVVAAACAAFAATACGAHMPADAAAPAASFPWCTEGLPWQEARSKVGSLVWMKGRVASSELELSARGRPTSIDVGRAPPSRDRLTVVIWGRSRRNFPAPPERMFRRGQMICAHGIVTRSAGVARMEVEFWDAAAGAATF